MPQCSVCLHPDRETIDVELLQGNSPRTVESRYGLSASALLLHREEHLNAPSEGDLMEPANRSDTWLRYDGSTWQPHPTPSLGDLAELHARPDDYRTAFFLDSHGCFIRKTCRLRKLSPRSSK